MICTITPIVNRQQAASYYSRDDYYSKDARKEDYWQGGFAKSIGLDGIVVDKKHIEEFINVVSNRDSIGEGKTPTLACDITFSVPKSVSLLQTVLLKYREIVNKCLEETTNEMIALIQDKYIRTRRGFGGKNLEYTHNFIAAGINHEVNRNDELDRLVHLFIPNLTQTKDGKILTIDIRYLMKQQKLFGAISRSKLASKLQREGIEIEVDDPQHGFYHVKGVSRDIEDKYITFRTVSNKVITFNAKQYNTFDFGYAMTVNKLQGAAVQKIICNVNSKSHMDRNKFYVTVSRDKSDVTILIDDIDKLQKNAQEWCHKVTSDDFIHNLEDEIAENHYKTVGSDYRDEVQRAIDLQHLADVSPVAIAEHNKIREKYGEVIWNKLPSFFPTFDSLRFSTPNQSTQKEKVKKIEPKRNSVFSR